MRVRCAMRMSSLGRVLLRAYLALIAGSLILDAPLAALIIFAIALVNLGVIGWRLVTFGQLMHRIIEAVARQAKLVPAEPVRGAALPIGGSRTA